MMKRQIPILVLLILAIVSLPFLVLSGPSATAANENKKGEEQPAQKDIAPDELTAGMTGYGLTVLAGSTVERFNVTYMGRLENALPGQDILLIHLDDEKFEKLGVMAGMSGSPIYFDGRLCGALAYGWSFAREPIAGVTPIANMRALKHGLSSPVKTREGRAAGVTGLIPLATPLMVSGLTESAQKGLDETLSSYGLQMIPSGTGSSSRAAKEAAIEPGAAVGVQLMRGAMNLTALGTVTEVDEDGMVYAFGHPFLAIGSTSLPMTTGVVEALMPSYQSSFKLGSPVEMVGSISVDRQPGVAGRLGVTPRMIPMSLSLEQHGETQLFEVEVIDDPVFTPLLLDAAWQSLLQGQTWAQGQATLASTLTVILEDGRRFGISDYTYGYSSPLENWVTLPVQVLYGNPFEPVSVERIEIASVVSAERKTAYVESARLLDDRLKPGEDLRVEIDLKPYGQPLESRIFTMALPENLPEGMYTLNVTAGRGYFSPGRVYPTTYEQLLEFLDGYERADQLILEIQLSQPGVAVKGVLLPSLPRRMRSIITGSPETGLQAAASYLREIHNQSWVLEGQLALGFQVKREETKR